MLPAKILVLSVIVMSVAACGQMPSVSRNASALSFTATQDGADDAMVEQARALDQMTKDILRRTTMQGAAIGAAAGCGLAVVSASEGGKCLMGALAGGAAGAVVGNAVGQRKVRERVELVSLSRVTPAISGAQKQMATLTETMPGLLESQDQEIADLKAAHAAGEISDKAYAGRMAEIRAARAEVAQALSMSAEQAHAAKLALKDAGAKGQTGLDWHIMSIETLEDEAVSARSRISLL